MGGMTIKDLLDAKGKRNLTYVQVAREEEAIAASEAGMDMIGTAFVAERAHFAKAVPDTHFQFSLPWGKHASATEALRDAMAAMQAGRNQSTAAIAQQLSRHWPAKVCPSSAMSDWSPPKQHERAGSNPSVNRRNKRANCCKTSRIMKTPVPLLWS